MDGVKALYYIAYYNLIQPWLPAGRAYIREVNDFLENAPPLHNHQDDQLHTHRAKSVACR
jgi:hypothetical protein